MARTWRSIVPLLREQRLITSIATCMTRLAAWWGSASVVLVTTEREHADRQAARTRLPTWRSHCPADDPPAASLACSRRTGSMGLPFMPDSRLRAAWRL